MFGFGDIYVRHGIVSSLGLMVNPLFGVKPSF